MEMVPNRKRPIYLNLFKIHQPIGAVVSILHRLTGVVLVLLLAPALYALDLSLRGPDGYERVLAGFGQTSGRLLTLVFGWVFAQHLFSGLRLLLLDLNIGIRLPVARGMAWTTLLASGIATLFLAVAYL